jgi:hypothetical protein
LDEAYACNQNNNYYLYHEVTNSELTYIILCKFPLIFGFTFVHDLFSYFLFCFCNLLIEIMKIIKLRQVRLEKSKLVSAASNQVRANHDQNEKAEIRMIFLIVTSGMTNFIFRFPELITFTTYSSFFTVMLFAHSHDVI